MNRAKICGIFLLVALVVICGIGVGRAAKQAPDEAYAGSIYDRLTPEVVQMYEREIANGPIVSDKSEAMLGRTAKGLKISVGKLKAIMLLQDLAARTGEDVSLSQLAEKSDFELILYGKQVGEKYAATLTPERRSELKSMLMNALKI